MYILRSYLVNRSSYIHFFTRLMSIPISDKVSPPLVLVPGESVKR